MAELTLRLSPENARRIVEFIDAGGRGKIVLHFGNRVITAVERMDSWQEQNPAVNGTRTFLPSATGVMIDRPRHVSV